MIKVYKYVWHIGGENGYHLLNLHFIAALVLSSLLNPYQMFSNVEKGIKETQHHTSSKNLRNSGDMKYVHGGINAVNWDFEMPHKDLSHKWVRSMKSNRDTA